MLCIITLHVLHDWVHDFSVVSFLYLKRLLDECAQIVSVALF